MKAETFEDGRRNCCWCGHRLDDEQVNPDLCSPCYRTHLAGLDYGASTEKVEQVEKEN